MKKTQEAIDPTTKNARLKELAKDKALWPYLAKNPNLPEALFVAFAEDAEEEVRAAIAQNPKTPHAILSLIAEDEWGCNSVTLALLSHPQLPLKALAALAQKHPQEFLQEPRVKALLKKDNKLIPLLSVEATMALLCVDSPFDGVFFDATDRHVPSWFLLALATHPDEACRACVPQWKETPKQLLLALAKDKSIHVRIGVATNPNTTPEALSILAKDKSKTVFTEEMLGVIVPTEQPIRGVVAVHPKTTAATLLELASDKSWEVRLAVLSNPRATSKMLDAITETGVNDPFGSLKDELLKHPKLSRKSRKQLERE